MSTMATRKKAPPNVLIIAGHDPGGGAGIQADIESVNANGCRCVSLITCLTAQNTAGFSDLFPQKPDRFRLEAKLLLSDVKVNACKIGLIGGIKLVSEIARILTSLAAELPLVIDPVLVSGTGTSLAGKKLTTAMKNDLFSLTTLLTPNTSEALSLTGSNDIYHAADILMGFGCRSVLITGADEKTPSIKNYLFSQDFEPEVFDWERLPGIYHGSGCTLSSSIAAQLALGKEMRTAVFRAQEFTWHSLKNGSQIGRKQKHPNRFYKYKGL